ncbi:mitochondrial genome maintenance MGM101 [Cokeromyces recurvatus]|uniref:mitochondrial genome maintenance MGM101 n=1 Tax=Cokeromyces recurvatus TaxID=90255 RepID=UPI0022211386|nr:mitochondrial genome maintenance MGM101 [Cokeromyces recurvatus]KAI7902527.1 mitochondrial genome maintenance MGM101 [Cokeromyces recurvatus]
MPSNSIMTQADHFPTTKQFDAPLDVQSQEGQQNWSSSFYGLSTERFPEEVTNILLQPINHEDVEIKPDGLLYLPEIKYRRILNKAFGPGGWGLAPRGEHTISPKNISREYALICSGRFVSQARGEQDFFDISGLPTASEGCKSNALMRCCKDLGIASELWDPAFIRKFKKKYCVEVWAEHVTTKKKKKLWRKKDDTLDYPYKEV